MEPWTSTRKSSRRKTHCQKWQITLQEAVEYFDHEYMTNRFYVTHFGGCAILFNKDTSVYLHGTWGLQEQDLKEGESGCHIKGIGSSTAAQRKWHIIILQEVIENVDSEFLTDRSYMTHYGGCAFLFNNDTFHQDIKVTSVYFRDTRDPQQQDLKEGESEWVLQGVISMASFRRRPRNSKSFFTTMSLHINNQFAKKRGIEKKLLLTIRAVMLEEHVDFVAGDFNGAAWRRPCGNDRKLASIIEEAFADTDLPVPPASTTVVGPRCSARRLGGGMWVSQATGHP